MPSHDNQAAQFAMRAEAALDCMRGLMVDFGRAVGIEEPHSLIRSEAENVLYVHQSRFNENFKLMVMAHNQRVKG